MSRVASDAAAFVGNLILDHRVRVGMTQDDLASASGIDSANIRAHEKGRSMPSIQTLVRIASALGIAPGKLVEGLTLELFDLEKRKSAEQPRESR